MGRMGYFANDQVHWGYQLLTNVLNTLGKDFLPLYIQIRVIGAHTNVSLPHLGKGLIFLKLHLQTVEQSFD